MKNIQYPLEPEEAIKTNREKLIFLLQNLRDDGLMENLDHLDYRKPFVIKHNIWIGGIFGNCSYNGQIDEKTGKPHGLGIAVTNKKDKIAEGVFKNGWKWYPRLEA